MARPLKEGLEYFPLDTDIDQDGKLIVVIAKYGNLGFGIVIRLMMEVYRKGYYYSWTEKEQHVFSMKVNEDTELVKGIVDECVKWGFFDEGIYQKHGILTSKGFQKRFLLAASRRKEAEIHPDYYLLGEVIADKNPQSTVVIADNNDTKEKKVNKSKRNKDMSVYEEIISYLNEKAGKKFSHKSDANKKLINGRMGEGRTIEDFKHVIDVKCKQWLDDPKMNEYLRPATLFAQKNFENYVNEKLKQQSDQQTIDPRDREIAFSKWVTDGGDPADFVYKG